MIDNGIVLADVGAVSKNGLIQNLILVGALCVVILTAMVWFVYSYQGRRRRHRHHHHHHHHHHDHEQPEGEGDPQSRPSAPGNTSSQVVGEKVAEDGQVLLRKRRRRRRREHRPRNPTLAETGGLPPIRTEGPPKP